MVVDEVVVWIGDPDASWRLIRIKKRPTSLSFHDQVTLNMILLFDSILDENNMALNIISDVIDQSHIVCTMKCEGSVEALMSTKAFAV